jgi:hypothetical protein
MIDPAPLTQPKEMKTKIEARYCWKVMSKEGHLSDPQTSWGDYVFNRYGYLTREEAIAALESGDHCRWGQDLVLLETYTRVTDWGNND